MAHLLARAWFEPKDSVFGLNIVPFCYPIGRNWRTIIVPFRNIGERNMLDALDRKIVAALERDARVSFGELAEAVGLSKTPCWKRVKALEDAGVIRGYSTRID